MAFTTGVVDVFSKVSILKPFPLESSVVGELAHGWGEVGALLLTALLKHSSMADS